MRTPITKLAFLTRRAIVTLCVLALPLLLTGCGDGETSFSDAFASLNDAFNNWWDKVF